MDPYDAAGAVIGERCAGTSGRPCGGPSRRDHPGVEPVRSVIAFGQPLIPQPVLSGAYMQR